MENLKNNISQLIESSLLESNYEGYREGYSKGYKEAISLMAMPLKEWDKVLWNDTEWNTIGEEYINKYKEIMEELPTHARHLLYELEQIELKQSDREKRLLYKHLTSSRNGGVSDDR